MIIVRIWEGIGNQLFQYAYARALKEKGFDVRLDIQKAYDESFRKYYGHEQRNNSIHKFNISLPSIDVTKFGKYQYLRRSSKSDKLVYWLATHHVWKYKYYEESQQCFSEESASISDNYYIKGWFQSERYFKDISGIILNELSLKKSPVLPEELSWILSAPNSVSIHVRRGDYVKIGLNLPAAYYKKAIDFVETRIREPVYVVFSDDTAWVKRKMDNGNFIYANEMMELKDYEELFLMSKCKSHIISNSTFGWWGAWLDDRIGKLVVCPHKWSVGQKEIVPDNWIIV